MKESKQREKKGESINFGSRNSLSKENEWNLYKKELVVEEMLIVSRA